MGHDPKMYGLIVWIAKQLVFFELTLNGWETSELWTGLHDLSSASKTKTLFKVKENLTETQEFKSQSRVCLI